MDAQQNIDQEAGINKIQQLLTQNLDNFKYLVLCNRQLEEKTRPSKEPLRLDSNRISEFQQETTESLEEWVNREFAPKPAKNERIKPKKTQSSRTIIDAIEQWLMEEAKKDLFAQMDVSNGSVDGLSSEYIRELGLNLISLADKLDKMKSNKE